MDSGEAVLRYRDVRDMSDSDEENMVQSDSDADSIDPTSAKPQEVEVEEQPAVKWSNPELYTAAPPTQDSSRKKKDVVKMIRKARVAAEKKADPPKKPTHNDDFISFDFNDEDQDGQPENGVAAEVNKPPDNAPSGPRSSKPLLNNEATGHIPLQMTVMDSSDSIAARLSDNRKRKRSTDEGDEEVDTYHELPPPKRRGKATLKVKANGNILPQWEADDVEAAVPWFTKGKHTFTETPGFR